MTKLNYSFLLGCFLFFTPYLGQAEINSTIDKLRDLTILMRTTESFCEKVREATVHVQSRGRLEFEQLQIVLKEELASKKDLKLAQRRARICRQDCSCSVFDGTEVFRAQVKKDASLITDQNYQKCKSNLDLNCESANLLDTITFAIKERDENEH